MDEDRRDQDQDEYVRSGKGRKDEVGRSGVYPASAADVPADAKPMGQEELGHRAREQPLAKTEDVELAEELTPPEEPMKESGD